MAGRRQQQQQQPGAEQFGNMNVPRVSQDWDMPSARAGPIFDAASTTVGVECVETSLGCGWEGKDAMVGAGV